MASKAEQVLIIEPANELSFKGPFTTAVSSVMKLTNPSSKKVCFKIKTTAPKRYCVKPNSGVIDPESSVQISVSLQPFEYDPNEKNRHKFMVQSMFAPDGDINQETLWKDTESRELMDSKLKCVFLMPEQENDVSMKDQEVTRSLASPKVTLSLENDSKLKSTVEEIKKLQEEVSALRQENIQLEEDNLRQKRLAASNTSRSSGENDSLTASAGAARYSSTVVTASNPNVTALNTAYLYAAVAIMVLGMLIGKWVL